MGGSPEDAEALVASLRRVCGQPDLPLPEPFDPGNDHHVDLAAGVLLDHFRRHNSADAFTLLVQVAQARMCQIARRLTRHLGLALDSDDLVAAFFARLFVDLRPDQPTVQRFLGLAYTSMRNDAFNQLRQFKRSQARHAQWGERVLGSTEDPALVIAEREQSELLQRGGTTFLLVVHHCFHALADRERRVLLAREVDGLSYDEIAARLSLPRNQVGMILKRARQHLAGRIADSLERLPEPGRTARAGRPRSSRRQVRELPPAAD